MLRITRRVQKPTLLYLLIVIAVSLAFTWPALVHGLPDLSNDGIDHARWGMNFATQFWQGEPYPRWLTATNGGLGAPALFFYPSMANYGSVVFRPLVAAHDPDGYIGAGWSAVLAGLIAAMTCYFWLCELASPSAALFGTMLYIMSPYHLAIDLYNRGALAEYWAFAWMPLVLLAAKRCAEGRRWGVPMLAISYGCLAFTHLPTVVCFSWAVPLAVWMMSGLGKRVAAFVRMSLGVALGIGLAAVYLVPAMLDQKKSWVADQITGNSWFYYRNNFLITRLVSPVEYKARVLFLVLSMVVCSVVFWSLTRRGDDQRKRLALLFALIGLGSLFMMTQLSIPVYEVFRFVQTIQFPTRFASPLTLALVSLAALAFPFLKQSRSAMAVVVLLVTGWLGADAWAGATAFSAWRKVPQTRIDADRKAMDLKREYYSLWPKPADYNLSELPKLVPFLEAHPARSLVLDMPGASATAEKWRPREILIHVHAPENGRMTVNHFYYADWRGSIDSRSVAVTPTPEGLILVEIPRGDYTLKLELIHDKPERAGLWISAISLLSIGVLAIVI